MKGPDSEHVDPGSYIQGFNEGLRRGQYVRLRRLPDLFPLIVLPATFIIGFMFPLSADPGVEFLFGWVVAVLAMVFVGWASGR